MKCGTCRHLHRGKFGIKAHFDSKFDKARSNKSREVPRQWYRVGCDKRGLSNWKKTDSTKHVATSHAKYRASGTAWGAINVVCQIEKTNSTKYLALHVVR